MTSTAHLPAIETWRPPPPRVAAIALGAGAALLAVGILAGYLFRQPFFQSYLFAFLFWWMASVGCLGLALLHNLTGGHWGEAIRPFLNAGMATLLLTIALFVPLAFGLTSIYEWARFDPSDAASDPLLAYKVKYYLNAPFVIARAVGYFAVWLAAAAIARRGARRPSAIALALLILAVSFAAIDWAMSLDPHWFSTIYGGLYLAGAAIAAMAISIVFLGSLAPRRAVGDPRSADVLNDLGNLLLAFVMIWAYFSFSQFLIIWSGNLPEENVWYVHRSQHGWQWVAGLIAALHFAAPFLFLLSRDVKRHPKTIVAVAGGLIAMRTIDLLWIVAPSFTERGAGAIVLDFIALGGVGGLWVAVFCWALKPPDEHAARRHGRHGAKRKGGGS